MNPARSLIGDLCLVIGLAAQAREATPLAADPALEARMLQIAEELRCVVCQNETVAASQAGIAQDLRQQIREQLAQGRTPAQIGDFMVERYGAFVRYRPAFDATTAALWLGPSALLVGAGVGLARQLRARRDAAPTAFTDADWVRLQALGIGDPASAAPASGGPSTVRRAAPGSAS